MGYLREAEVELARGKTVPAVVRMPGAFPASRLGMRAGHERRGRWSSSPIAS